MPAYEYEAPDGTRFIRVCAVQDRDNHGPGIRRVMSAPVVITSHAVSDFDMRKNVMKGYRSLEEKHGSRFRSSYTPEQIKKAWNN